jgi:uncharacterized oligopeptide transporter (OPT) family protein
MDSVEQKLKALEAFKDWSNYLLVTTVAALGWVSTKPLGFSPTQIRAWCIWSFAISIFFGILTLALVPHIAELLGPSSQSIYSVYWNGWGPKLELFYACLPEHAFFLLGVMLYAYGVSRGTPVA